MLSVHTNVISKDAVLRLRFFEIEHEKSSCRQLGLHSTRLHCVIGNKKARHA